jgi:hypothetical protein
MAPKSLDEKTSWDFLAPPVTSPTVTARPGASVNVLFAVPAQIRQRAEKSLAINTKRVLGAAASTADRVRVDYHWDVQPLPDDKIAADFRDLLTKYAKHRPSSDALPHADAASPKGQVTARCGKPSWFRTNAGGEAVTCDKTEQGAYFGVRYSVRPFEHRKDTTKLPGS